MKPRYVLDVCIFLIISFLGINNVFSQIKEEKVEKTLEVNKLQGPPSYQLSSSIATFFGYDSNANLDTSRKPDTFEELLYSLDFVKHLTKDIKFIFFYDFDVLNYNHFTKISNILNHLQFGLDKGISMFNIGTTYDLSIFSYPNSNDDFIFNKGIFYIKQKISKRVSHKLQFEIGGKDYLHRKALDTSLITYQDKDRQDNRLSIGYAITSYINPNLLLGFKTKFSKNDSNAKYLDFYDYESYENSLRLDYKLMKDLFILTNFTHIRKNYTSRTITSADTKEKDNLYTGTLGFLYNLDKKNSFSLYYTYRWNSSNEDLEEYGENLITCGWQHLF